MAKYFIIILQQAKVTAHWHNGNTLYMVKFDEAVIMRDKGLDAR